MPKVDLTNYLDREQAYVKHYLLQEYLPELTYRVGRNWNAIAYVDGFAGPWQTKDPNYADSSFGVAIRALEEGQRGLLDAHNRHVHMNSVLVEAEQDAYSRLKKFADTQTKASFEVHAVHGEFVESIPRIEELINASDFNTFKFVLLDPTGWAQIPMRRLQPFFDNRSCEVLINLMTGHIVRFLNEADRAESYRDLFGRNEVLDILKQTPPEERTEVAVQEYCNSLRLLCRFKFVSAAVILKPSEERISYFLVYATNHPRGVEVFKAAELKAARIQDEVRHEARIRKTRQPTLLFDDAPPSSRLSTNIRMRYADKAKNRVLEMLSSHPIKTTLLYENLLCEAMAFPLVAPRDLVGWLRALEPDVEMRLTGTGRRRPVPRQGDELLVLNPEGLRQTGKARLEKA